MFDSISTQTTRFLLKLKRSDIFLKFFEMKYILNEYIDFHENYS